MNIVRVGNWVEHVALQNAVKQTTYIIWSPTEHRGVVLPVQSTGLPYLQFSNGRAGLPTWAFKMIVRASIEVRRVLEVRCGYLRANMESTFEEALHIMAQVLPIIISCVPSKLAYTSFGTFRSKSMPTAVSTWSGPIIPKPCEDAHRVAWLRLDFESDPCNRKAAGFLLLDCWSWFVYGALTNQTRYLYLHVISIVIPWLGTYFVYGGMGDYVKVIPSMMSRRTSRESHLACTACLPDIVERLLFIIFVCKRHVFKDLIWSLDEMSANWTSSLSPYPYRTRSPLTTFPCHPSRHNRIV
ncbi:hypothetical protein BJ170DRAFT_631988 [Xylariales sp. AK1849]|nr:hypothetical protein BJ170DRAFT_631988 [Xylariales sp. AK1849]